MNSFTTPNERVTMHNQQTPNSLDTIERNTRISGCESSTLSINVVSVALNGTHCAAYSLRKKRIKLHSDAVCIAFPLPTHREKKRISASADALRDASFVRITRTTGNRRASATKSSDSTTLIPSASFTRCGSGAFSRRCASSEVRCERLSFWSDGRSTQEANS